MGKELKTNAMRFLDKSKIEYTVQTYECDEFIDGIHTAEKLGERLGVIVHIGRSSVGFLNKLTCKLRCAVLRERKIICNIIKQKKTKNNYQQNTMARPVSAHKLVLMTM